MGDEMIESNQVQLRPDVLLTSRGSSEEGTSGGRQHGMHGADSIALANFCAVMPHPCSCTACQHGRSEYLESQAVCATRRSEHVRSRHMGVNRHGHTPLLAQTGRLHARRCWRCSLALQGGLQQRAYSCRWTFGRHDTVQGLGPDLPSAVPVPES